MGISKYRKLREKHETLRPALQKSRVKSRSRAAERDCPGGLLIRSADGGIGHRIHGAAPASPSLISKNAMCRISKPSIRASKSRFHRPPSSVDSFFSDKGLPESVTAVPVFLAAFLFMALLCGGFLDQWLLFAGKEETVSIPISPNMPEPSVPVDLASLAGPTVFPSSSSISESSALVFTRHRVARGETLARIAFNYGLSPATLISVNGFREPDDIRGGIVMIVPYTDGIRVPVKEGTLRETADKYGVEIDSISTLPDGSYFVTGKDFLPTISASFSEEVFLAPVDGKILTAFGESVDNLTGIPFRSEGIDFSIFSGTPVQTAKAGTVVLTGQHSSYGLYVMMSHPGGWKSFYGHLSRVDVAVGDELERGAVLGLSGNSGNARSPRLHFSLLRDGELVDPLDYLF